MKKLTSIILAIAISVTTICALCSCTPPPPQLVSGDEAYSKYKIINDEDIMNIACIAGYGPLKYDDRGLTPIEFTQTVEFTPISDEELQAIANELYGNDDTLIFNKNLFIYFFGEYHGYYALGVHCTGWKYTEEAPKYGSVDEIYWIMKHPYYIIYIYTTPEKTRV